MSFESTPFEISNFDHNQSGVDFKGKYHINFFISIASEDLQTQARKRQKQLDSEANRTGYEPSRELKTDVTQFLLSQLADFQSLKSKSSVEMVFVDVDQDDYYALTT